jgi:tRNA-splicing ligase RtcB
VTSHQIGEWPWWSKARASGARDREFESSLPDQIHERAGCKKGKTMTDATYNVMKPDKGVPIKAWTKGVPLEDAARQQLLNVAQLPFIYKWVAAMPDVHWGIGAQWAA